MKARYKFLPTSILAGLLTLFALLPANAQGINSKQRHYAHCVAWKQDGTLLSGWSDGFVRIKRPGQEMQKFKVSEFHKVLDLIAPEGEDFFLASYSPDGSGPSMWVAVENATGTAQASWETHGINLGKASAWLPAMKALAWVDDNDRLYAMQRQSDGSWEALATLPKPTVGKESFLVMDGGKKLLIPAMTPEILDLVTGKSSSGGDHDWMVFRMDPATGLGELNYRDPSTGPRNILAFVKPSPYGFGKALAELSGQGGEAHFSGDGNTLVYNGSIAGRDLWSVALFKAPDWKEEPWKAPPGGTAYYPNHDGSKVAVIYPSGVGDGLRIFDLNGGGQLDSISLEKEVVSRKLAKISWTWSLFMIVSIALILAGRISNSLRGRERSPLGWKGSRIFSPFISLAVLAYSFFYVSTATGAEAGMGAIFWSVVLIIGLFYFIASAENSEIKEALIIAGIAAVVAFAADFLFRMLPRGDLFGSTSSSVRWSSGRAFSIEGSGFWLYPLYTLKLSAGAIAFDFLVQTALLAVKKRKGR